MSYIGAARGREYCGFLIGVGREVVSVTKNMVKKTVAVHFPQHLTNLTQPLGTYKVIFFAKFVPVLATLWKGRGGEGGRFKNL